MKLVIAIGLCLALDGVAAAANNCTNDIDCADPGGNHCGGMVCQWSASGHNCVPAGTDAQGTDGWCTSDTDCKCMAQGAACMATKPHCSFTLIQDMSGPARDLASTPAADLSLSTSGDLSVAGAADLSLPTPPATPPATKKSGCAIVGDSPDASALALLLAALVGLHRRRRAQ